MNTKTTFILFLVLLAVGVIVAITARHGDEPAQVAAEKKLIDLDQGEIIRVVLTPAGGTNLTLEKRDNKWLITEPLNARAQSYNVEDLVRGLTNLKARGTVPGGVEMGLNPPRYKIEVYSRDGKQVKLAVGNKSAVGDVLYVQLGDEAKPQVVSSDLDPLLAKRVDEYRDAKVIDTSSMAIGQVTISRPNEKITIEKKGEDWHMASPTSMPVDTGQAGDVTRAIADISAVEWVDSPGNLALYQLSEPRLTVAFSDRPPSTQPATTQAASQPAPKTIRFGRYEDILKKNIYAAVGDAVIKVSAETFNSLNKTPLDLRDRRVVDLDTAKVRKITIDRELNATTQPTTRAASKTSVVLEKRKETPATIPTTAPVAATIPATKATTVAATTQSTMPTTIAASAPVTPPPPPREFWAFVGDRKGEPDATRVGALLNNFHPLRATKYLAKAPATQPSERIVVKIDSGEPDEIVFTQVPGVSDPIARYKDLVFEVDKSLVTSLTEDFTKSLRAAPAAPEMPE